MPDTPPPAGPAPERVVCLCPVCLGRGYVPQGFYRSTPGQAWVATGTAPERCRTCDGTGTMPSEGGRDGEG